MTSEEINKRLKDFEDREFPPRLCYGWFWRDVDFDKDYCRLAFMPEQEPDFCTLQVGYQ